MRQKERNIEIIEQHGLGLRVIFSILGVMIIILSTIGHMYMKNRRFIPLGLNQQLAYIKSIGIIPMVQIALFVFGLRCLMLNSQQYK